MRDVDATNNRPQYQLGEFALMLIPAVALLLLTDNVAVAAALPSINAGSKSFISGIWILSTDQQHLRARICAAFLFATGCWRAAAAALISVIVFVAVFHLFGKPPNLERFAVTMTILAVGVSLTTFVGLAATMAAAVTGVRVWVHPRLHELLHGELENAAHLAPNDHFNHAVFVVATSTGLPATSLSAQLIITPRSGAVTATVLFGGVLFAIACYRWLSSQTIAQHRSDCWSSPSSSHDHADQCAPNKWRD